jgi:hypothetical protein
MMCEGEEEGDGGVQAAEALLSNEAGDNGETRRLLMG